MRDYIMPAKDRPEEFTSISMPELENRIKRLDTMEQEVVSYHVRGFSSGEITQKLGCPQEYAESTIHHFTCQLLETSDIE